MKKKKRSNHVLVSTYTYPLVFALPDWFVGPFGSRRRSQAIGLGFEILGLSKLEIQPGWAATISEQPVNKIRWGGN